MISRSIMPNNISRIMQPVVLLNDPTLRQGMEKPNSIVD
jgi:hypothetical protein